MSVCMVERFIDAVCVLLNRAFFNGLLSEIGMDITGVLDGELYKMME